jgi:hypothetical protein
MAGTRSAPAKAKPDYALIGATSDLPFTFGKIYGPDTPVTVELPSDGSLELVTKVAGKRIVLVTIPPNIMSHLLRADD